MAAWGKNLFPAPADDEAREIVAEESSWDFVEP